MDLNKTRSHNKEKFNDINFIEESHQYFIGEDEYTPVSNIISEFEPYVNWNEKAEKSAFYDGALYGFILSLFEFETALVYGIKYSFSSSTVIPDASCIE